MNQHMLILLNDITTLIDLRLMSRKLVSNKIAKLKMKILLK